MSTCHRSPNNRQKEINERFSSSLILFFLWFLILMIIIIMLIIHFLFPHDNRMFICIVSYQDLDEFLLLFVFFCLFFVWQMVPMREKINHQLWTHSLINRTNRTCVMVSRALLNTSGTRFNENCLDRLIVKNYFRFINIVRTKLLPLSFFVLMTKMKWTARFFSSFFLPSFLLRCSLIVLGQRNEPAVCISEGQFTSAIYELTMNDEVRIGMYLYMFDQREHFN